MEFGKRTIVIGASAGGIPAVSKLLAGLPDLAGLSILVVLHLSRTSNAKNIVSIFQKHTSLICKVAVDGSKIEDGHLYLAPSDHHLLIKDDKIIVHQGPHENRYRPSIDVLFRSAAVSLGNAVIGVVLTGMLDDGTSGMYAINKTGGICIVQDPTDAEYDDMPRSVLNLVDVDYTANLKDMQVLIAKLCTMPLPLSKAIPPEIKKEADLTEKMMSDINELKKIADQSDFVCPDCGGGLWAIKNDPTHRYRCHTGHVYTEQTLYEQHGDHLEQSVWVAIRMLEERRNMLALMASHASDRNEGESAILYRIRAEQMETHIGRMKTILTTITKSSFP